MTFRFYAFTCGTVTGAFARLMEGGEGEITSPRVAADPVRDRKPLLP